MEVTSAVQRAEGGSRRPQCVKLGWEHLICMIGVTFALSALSCCPCPLFVSISGTRDPALSVLFHPAMTTTLPTTTARLIRGPQDTGPLHTKPWVTPTESTLEPLRVSLTAEIVSVPQQSHTVSHRDSWKQLFGHLFAQATDTSTGAQQ